MLGKIIDGKLNIMGNKISIDGITYTNAMAMIMAKKNGYKHIEFIGKYTDDTITEVTDCGSYIKVEYKGG